MAVLSLQSIPDVGKEVTFVAATLAGDSFPNSGYARVRVKNDSGSPKRVKFEGQGTDNFGLAGDFTDKEITVPANKVWDLPPLAKSRFNDSNGRVQMTYPDGVTSLSVAVVAG